MPMIRVLARIAAFWIPPAEVRAERWAIGVRHDGRVVQGAVEEGKAPGLNFRQAILLKAVIREHRRILRDQVRSGRP